MHNSHYTSFRHRVVFINNVYFEISRYVNYSVQTVGSLGRSEQFTATAGRYPPTLFRQARQ